MLSCEASEFVWGGGLVVGKPDSAQLTDGIQMHISPRYNSECTVEFKISTPPCYIVNTHIYSFMLFHKRLILSQVHVLNQPHTMLVLSIYSRLHASALTASHHQAVRAEIYSCE